MAQSMLFSSPKQGRYTMRRSFAVFPGFLAAVVLLVGCAQPDQQPPPPSVGRFDVHVNIACPATGITTATVQQWVINVSPGDAIRILFTGGGSAAASMTVTPKDAGAWPLTPAPTGGSYTVASGPNGLSLTVPAGTDTGTYRYTVAGQCTINGTTHTITIDPDIVVN